VARLLGKGRDVNEANETGWTALILASQNGDVEVVLLVIGEQSGCRPSASA
jgi:ankyrin repeat protein